MALIMAGLSQHVAPLSLLYLLLAAALGGAAVCFISASLGTTTPLSGWLQAPRLRKGPPGFPAAHSWPSGLRCARNQHHVRVVLHAQ